MPEDTNCQPDPSPPDPFIVSDPFWGEVENFRMARVALVAVAITALCLPVLVVLLLNTR